MTSLQQPGDLGAVASTHWLATATAMSVLGLDLIPGSEVLAACERGRNGTGIAR